MRLVQVIFGEEGEVSRRINWAMQPILFQLQNSPVGIKANLHSVLAAAANKKQFAAENAISLLPSHNHQCWHQLSTLHCNNIELLKMLLRKKNWAGSLNSIDHTSWRNARSVLYFMTALAYGWTQGSRRCIWLTKNQTILKSKTPFKRRLLWMGRERWRCKSRTWTFGAARAKNIHW